MINRMLAYRGTARSIFTFTNGCGRSVLSNYEVIWWLSPFGEGRVGLTHRLKTAVSVIVFRLSNILPKMRCTTTHVRCVAKFFWQSTSCCELRPQCLMQQYRDIYTKSNVLQESVVTVC